MFRSFEIPLTWGELFKRTFRETSTDNCLGLAAQLAFYFLLALVPAIVFVVAIASFFPGRVIEDIISTIRPFTPQEVLNILTDQLRSIAGGENVGILTFGFVMALWSSSAAIVSITDALNRAYDIDEGRPWWKVRLTAMGLTLALAVFVLTAFALVMLGPTLAEWIATYTGYGAVLEWTWKIAQWPIIFFLVTLAVALVNYFGPDAEQEWQWITPGSVLTTLLWLVTSLGFKIYLARFADYNETYGSLGGVIVLMLWFYLTGLAILVGAELNAEIEHASPHGKAPGEKVPGQKKKIGRLAARAYEEWLRRRPSPRRAPSLPNLTPSTDGPPPVHAFRTRPTTAFSRATAWFRKVQD